MHKKITEVINFLKTFEENLYEYNLQIITASDELINRTFIINQEPIDKFDYIDKIKTVIKMIHEIPQNAVDNLFIQFNYCNITKTIINQNKKNSPGLLKLNTSLRNTIIDNCSGQQMNNCNCGIPEMPGYQSEQSFLPPPFLNNNNGNNVGVASGFSRLSKNDQEFFQNFIAEVRKSINPMNPGSSRHNIPGLLLGFLKEVEQRGIPKTIALEYLFENGIAVNETFLRPDDDDDSKFNR